MARVNCSVKTKTNSGARSYWQCFYEGDSMLPLEVIEGALANNAKLQVSNVVKYVREADFELPDPASLTNEISRRYYLGNSNNPNIFSTLVIGPLEPRDTYDGLDAVISSGIFYYDEAMQIPLDRLIRVSSTEHEV